MDVFTFTLLTGFGKSLFKHCSALQLATEWWHTSKIVPCTNWQPQVAVAWLNWQKKGWSDWSSFNVMGRKFQSQSTLRFFKRPPLHKCFLWSLSQLDTWNSHGNVTNYMQNCQLDWFYYDAYKQLLAYQHVPRWQMHLILDLINIKMSGNTNIQHVIMLKN